MYPYSQNRFRLRPSTIALSLLAGQILVLGLTFVATVWRLPTTDHNSSRALIQELGLSDLSLFTEARYTRHPTQADRHTPFQDHPAALEHFPTGALLPPSRDLTLPAN
jgi:hypothetical protein